MSLRATLKTPANDNVLDDLSLSRIDHSQLKCFRALIFGRQWMELARD